MKFFIASTLIGLASAASYDCSKHNDQTTLCTANIECEYTIADNLCKLIVDGKVTLTSSKHDAWGKCATLTSGCGSAMAAYAGCDSCTVNGGDVCLPTKYLASVEMAASTPLACKTVIPATCSAYLTNLRCSGATGCVWVSEQASGVDLGRCYNVEAEKNSIKTLTYNEADEACKQMYSTSSAEACIKNVGCGYCDKLKDTTPVTIENTSCYSTDSLIALEKANVSGCTIDPVSLYGCDKLDTKEACTNHIGCEYLSMYKRCIDIQQGAPMLTEVNSLWNTCTAQIDCGASTSAAPGCDKCKVGTSSKCIPTEYVALQTNTTGDKVQTCETIVEKACSSFLTEDSCLDKANACVWAHAMPNTRNGGCFDVTDEIHENLMVMLNEAAALCSTLDPASCLLSRECGLCTDTPIDGCLSDVYVNAINAASSSPKCQMTAPPTSTTSSFSPSQMTFGAVAITALIASFF